MNNKDLFSSFGEIDESLVERSERAASRSRSRRAIKMIAAAAAALLIIAGAAFGIAQAAGANKGEMPVEQYAFIKDTKVPEDAVLPPESIGQGKVNAEYVKNYTIPEAYAEADIVCLARVGNWLGETDIETFYEAVPLVTYKGELPSPFILREFGNSEFTLSGTVLYTYGDILLLFLTQRDYEGYNSSYECIGADLTMLYASVDDSGNVYLIDPRGLISYYTEVESPDAKLTNLGRDSKLVSELCSNMRNYNKRMADHFQRYYDNSVNDELNVPFPLHVFSLEEVVCTCFDQ